MSVGDRLAPLAVVLARAVDADAEAAALQDRIDAERRAGAAMFVSHLASVGGLRDGLTRRPEAADMCWVLMNPLLQRRLRGRARLDPRPRSRTGWCGWRRRRCSTDARRSDRSKVTAVAETRWEQARAQERADGPGRVRRALRAADGRGRRHRGRGPPGRRARSARGAGSSTPARAWAGSARRLVAPRAPRGRGRLRPRDHRPVAPHLPRPAAWSTSRLDELTAGEADRGGPPDVVRPHRVRRQRDDPARARHRAHGARPPRPRCSRREGRLLVGFGLRGAPAAARAATRPRSSSADCAAVGLEVESRFASLRPAAVHRRQHLRRARAAPCAVD